jgi:undecaprenyl-diphosphatase
MGLAVVGKDLIASSTRGLSRRELTELCLTVAPVALAGLVLERPIENRLGSQKALGYAELAGGLLMACSDLQTGSRAGAPGYADYLLVGTAQSAALVPGISRSGAALTVLRLRGFDRAVATRLTQKACLPVLMAAATLKTSRLRAHGPPRRAVPSFVAGACLAFASTIASARLMTVTTKRRSFPILSAYRVCLGLFAIASDKRSRVR